MFTPYLPLAVFSFSVKLSSFALASKARIILHDSYLKLIFQNINVNLAFAVNTIVNLSNILTRVRKTQRVSY